MRTFPVSVDSIQIGERHRALNEDAVGRLQASIKELGLQQPITIRVAGGDGAPVLVAGQHRLEAVRRLGWKQIDCIEVSDDALRAELWEIAENLHRCDLTKEQRDEHIRRYAELLVEIENEAKRLGGQNVQAVLPDGRRAGPQHEKQLAAKIAEKTGLSAKTVKRALDAPQKSAVPPAKKPSPNRSLTAAGKQLEALRRAWRQASKEARAQFLSEIKQAA